MNKEKCGKENINIGTKSHKFVQKLWTLLMGNP